MNRNRSKMSSCLKLAAILTLVSLCGSVGANELTTNEAPPTESQKHAMNMAMEAYRDRKTASSTARESRGMA